MKTSDKSLVVSIKIIPCAKWKVQWASRVSFKSNWMDISIEALFISCHTLQWGVDIKNAKNAPDSVTCLAAPHPPYRKTQCPALANMVPGKQSLISPGNEFLFELGWQHFVCPWLCPLFGPVLGSCAQIPAFLQRALDKVIWSFEKRCVLPEIKKGLKSSSPADFTFIEVDDGWI